MQFFKNKSCYFRFLLIWLTDGLSEFLVRNGRKIAEKAFCVEMDCLCSKDECVFTHAGCSHVAAIVPIEDYYKIIDSWAGSSRRIGGFWVKSSDKPILGAKAERMFYSPLVVGDSLSRTVA